VYIFYSTLFFKHSPAAKTTNDGEGLVRTPAVRSADVSQSLVIRHQRNEPQVPPATGEGTAMAGHAERCYGRRVSLLHSPQYVFYVKDCPFMRACLCPLVYLTLQCIYYIRPTVLVIFSEPEASAYIFSRIQGCFAGVHALP
jgi:hypothetical protein